LEPIDPLSPETKKTESQVETAAVTNYISEQRGEKLSKNQEWVGLRKLGLRIDQYDQRKSFWKGFKESSEGKKTQKTSFSKREKGVYKGGFQLRIEKGKRTDF